MPEYIGPVEIPEIGASGGFPLVLAFGMATVTDQRVVEHRFGSNDAMTSQRFLVGNGARRVTISYGALMDSEYSDLIAFYSDRYGSYQPFLLDIPRPDGSTEQLTVRFANPTLTLDQVEEMVYSGTIELVEEPSSNPSYSVSATQTRFPGSSLQTALLAAAQEIIPLVKIVAGAYTIYLSDRRVTVGGNLYQPRLLDWQPVTQSLGGASDSASFTLGNADRVFTNLVNQQDLAHARIEFSLFHVGTTTKLDFWAGHVTGVEGGDSPEFRINAADALYELRLPYPRQTIDPQGGFSLPNQPVNVGGKKGIAKIRATSVANDSAYGKPLRDIYVSDSDYPMPVECDLIAGRDESEFFAALGVVGRGPISGYASGDERWRHLLDGQPNHGPGALGLRRAYGGNPTTGDPTAIDNSPDSGSQSFALDETGNPLPSNPLDGVAFIQIRRTDDKGIQPARADTHKMTAYVSGGLGCWTWTTPGSRAWTPACTNPVWIAVNVLLRGRGLETASAANQEAVFDCAAAIAAAAACDTSVTPIIGDAVSETQFQFTGRIEEQRPLREWIEEILNCSLGYSSFVFDKLRIGVRINSSVVEAFTLGNVVYGSVSWSGAAPQYNSLRVGFADRERGYAQYQVHHRDADAITRAGKEVQASLDVPGVATKSQAARLAITRLREEMGGLTEEEQRKAGLIRFRTTILALNTEPGQVCSLTHPSIPGGACEFRVTSWRLNRDWSVDIEGRTTTDSMYDYTVGDKPTDVEPDPLPEIDRQDLYPGDVTLGTITAAVVEDSNGVQLIELAIPYTPPSVTRGFVGVSVRVERPNIKSEVYDFDYSETAPAQDTERLRLEPPESTENWIVRVTSRSNVLRRPFSSTTPSQTISVDAVDPIGGGATPPDQPDITGWIVALGPSQADAITGEQKQRVDVAITRDLPVEADYWEIWVRVDGGAPDRYPTLSLYPSQTDVEVWIVRTDATQTCEAVLRAAGASYAGIPPDDTAPWQSVTIPALAAASAPASWSATLEYSTAPINGVYRGRYAFTVDDLPASPNTAAIVVEFRLWSDPDSAYIDLSGYQSTSATALQSGGDFSWNQGPFTGESWGKPESPESYALRLAVKDHRGMKTYHPTVLRLDITAGGGFQVSALTGKTGHGLAIRSNQLVSLSRDLQNGDFEDDLTGWSIGNSVEIVATGGASGQKWAKLNAIGAWNGITQRIHGASGQSKRLTVRARNTSNADTSIVCGWLDSSYAYLTHSLVTIPPGASDWTAYTVVSPVAPANAAYCYIAAEVYPASSTGYMGVDAFLVEDVASVAATGTAPAGLSINSSPYPTSRDRSGFEGWYVYASWTPETQTPARSDLEFFYAYTTSDWSQSLSVLKPIGKVSIEQGALDCVPQNYGASTQYAKVWVYLLSKDGTRAFLQTFNLTIPASPANALNLGNAIDRSLISQKIALEAVTTAEIATSIDPPIFSVTPPGAIYLGRRYVTYASELYEWTGAVYRKVLNATGIKAELAVSKLTSDHLASNSAIFGIVASGAIGADQMRAVEFILKGDGSRPPRWIARTAANADVAMIGQYGGEDGLWAVNGRFGGTWASPAAQFSSSAAALNGVDFTLVKNGVTTKVKNEPATDPTEYGITVEAGNYKSGLSPYGLNVYVSGVSYTQLDQVGLYLRNALSVGELLGFGCTTPAAFGDGVSIQSGALDLISSAVLKSSGYTMIDASRNIGHGTVYNSDTGIVNGINEYRNLSVPSDLSGGASLSDVINTLNALLQALRTNSPITDIVASTVQKWVAGYTAGLSGLTYQGKIPCN